MLGFLASAEPTAMSVRVAISRSVARHLPCLSHACALPVPSNVFAPIRFAVLNSGFEIGIVKLKLVTRWVQKIEGFSFCFVLFPLLNVKIYKFGDQRRIICSVNVKSDVIVTGIITPLTLDDRNPHIPRKKVRTPIGFHDGRESQDIHVKSECFFNVSHAPCKVVNP